MEGYGLAIAIGPKVDELTREVRAIRIVGRGAGNDADDGWLALSRVLKSDLRPVFVVSFYEDRSCVVCRTKIDRNLRRQGKDRLRDIPDQPRHIGGSRLSRRQEKPISLLS